MEMLIVLGIILVSDDFAPVENCRVFINRSKSIPDKLISIKADKISREIETAL